MNIYLAGPLFSKAERNWIREIRHHILAFAKKQPMEINASSLFGVGKLEIKLSSDEIDHGDEIFAGAIASGFGLGRLDQTVDAFQHPVADAGGKPTQHPGPVTFDGLGGFDHRLQPTMGGPEIPFFEPRFG